MANKILIDDEQEHCRAVAASTLVTFSRFLAAYGQEEAEVSMQRIYDLLKLKLREVLSHIIIEGHMTEEEIESLFPSYVQYQERLNVIVTEEELKIRAEAEEISKSIEEAQTLVGEEFDKDTFNQLLQAILDKDTIVH